MLKTHDSYITYSMKEVYSNSEDEDDLEIRLLEAKIARLREKKRRRVAERAYRELFFEFILKVKTMQTLLHQICS